MKDIKKAEANPEVLLYIALSVLPLHAEESRRRDSLPEDDLVAALVTQAGAEHETAVALVYTLRRQFEALGLLDRLELQNGFGLLFRSLHPC